MAQKARMKIFERMKNGTRRHILTIHGVGRTKALAKANVRRNARTALRRNISEGFYDATGFHPIRSASDYSRKAAGEKPLGRRGKRAHARRSGALYSKYD